MNFVQELKRRNVFKVGAAYLVMGWVLVQVVNTFLPTFGAPEWVQKTVMFLIILGFPLALFFAWAFEVTPDGVKPTREVDPDQSVTASTGGKINYVIITALLVALGYSFYSSNILSDKPVDLAQQQTDVSIAVLPFVNMSSDPEQEFFSDGISEEILNVLVKVPDLKVAGRTSSFAYKGQNKDLREIGANLNVNHILEGSVRRSGTRLRITAQLIRSEDGFHLWSETYDRELADVFDIQDEISAAIAEELRLSLNIGIEGLSVTRTDDLKAYEGYLKGKELYRAREHQQINEATVALSKVIARDPNFAPAWATLAQVYSVSPYYVRPVPNGGMQHFFDLAIIMAEKTLELDPNSSVAYTVKANVQRDRKNYIEALRNYEKALELDPKNADTHQQFAEALGFLGYKKRAISMARRALELDPGRRVFYTILSRLLKENNELEKAGEVALYIIEQFPDFEITGEILLEYYYKEQQFESAIELLRRLNITAGSNYERYWASLDLLLAEKMGTLTAEFIAEARKVFPPVLPQQVNPDMTLAELIELLPLLPSTNPFIMDAQFINYRDLPEFKSAVKTAGIFEVWQELGFPDYCRPLGEDDFECDKNTLNSE